MRRSYCKSAPSFRVPQSHGGVETSSGHAYTIECHGVELLLMSTEDPKALTCVHIPHLNAVMMDAGTPFNDIGIACILHHSPVQWYHNSQSHKRSLRWQGFSRSFCARLACADIFPFEYPKLGRRHREQRTQRQGGRQGL
jgi:hypothetical protein